MRLPTHAAIAAIASLAIQTAVAAQSANSEERFNRILTGVTKPGPSSAKRYYLCIFSRGYETRWSAGTTRLTISQLEKDGLV